MTRSCSLSSCSLILLLVLDLSCCVPQPLSQTPSADEKVKHKDVCRTRDIEAIYAREGLAEFFRVHDNERRLHEERPWQRKSRRFLACKPMGGIGNYISGLMSCLAMAMATNRSLLLAKPPPTPPEKTTTYDVPVSQMFDFPVNMSLGIFGPVEDIPFLVDKDGNAQETADLQMIDIRSHDLLCINFSSVYHKPIVVMPAHLWLSAITMNKFHSPWFQEHYGVDRHGVVPFVQKVGPSFVRPKRELQALIDQLWGFLTKDVNLNNVIGLQVRVGMPIDTRAYNDRPPPGSAPEFVRCAYSYMSAPCKERPSAWIIAADQMQSKREIIVQIAINEGPVVAAANEEGLRNTLGIPADFFAHDGKLSPPAGTIKQLPFSEALAQLGFALLEFASGARALVLASSSPMSTISSMRAAVVEMFLLKLADLLVITENSTFWIPAVAFVPRRRWGDGEKEHRCKERGRSCCDDGVYIMTTTRRLCWTSSSLTN
ncbi:hypothetical protein GUITHDRAFT_103102 [Guillardia theta CCMP2712]|uniref:Uncharacterized protein n=1 Tax=Guillardia theta (strain CCMP2712) TaxID=905079 RepID=L1JRJ1_GUITC|nr:hypothetical protein GUITHDRAFT_103102 [Guillardia theta CCMP2712]EKX51186.1 hypothetical protein GUITHDRAFT_103102 [Guillardia theta CCMP2712]|eukprot:XP_005838166.1 hypothetical protein GUITHDRAFT_103102 [Guillardia theta CCMP2712]